MKTVVYFNLNSQQDVDRFVVFLKETVVPALLKLGGQNAQLYETTSDALSRYMLEVTFQDEAMAQGALESDDIKALNESFMEFVESATLISYTQVC